MKVPFLDLKQQYSEIAHEIKKAIDDVFEQSLFVLGAQVFKFEKEFAEYSNTSFSCALNSGTDALRFALIASGIKPGDEVITVPNTFIATTEAISQVGARISFVDIDERTYNIDPEKIEKAITSKTKAIMPVHIYGQCADMDSISKIAKAYNLIVIEDSCQAHGALYKGKKAGSIGVAGGFSFFPSKNLGAYGDGGAITTNSHEIYEYVCKLRHHGQAEKGYHDFEGYNSRLDTIQASVLSVKLKYLDEWNETRRKNAYYYNELLKDSNVITPYEPEWSKSVYHLYVIRVNERDKVQRKLSEAGIGTGLHYPLPLHLQKAYKHLGYIEGDFPVSEKLSREIISLPLFPELTKYEIDFIVESIKKVC